VRLTSGFLAGCVSVVL